MEEQNIKELLESLHPLEVKVLDAFKSKRVWRHSELQEKTALSSSQLDSALGWLQAKGLVRLEKEFPPSRKVRLTERGKSYANRHLPELRIKDLLNQAPHLTIEALKSQGILDPDELSAAIGELKKKGAITIGEGGILKLERTEDFKVLERLQEIIKDVYARGDMTFENIPHDLRPLIEERHHKRAKEKGVFEILEVIDREYMLEHPLGERVIHALERPSEEVMEFTQLTPQMLKEGSWRGKSFRKYNINLKPSRVLVGKRHPYREFLDSVKTKLVAMGFEEMRGPLVETEFWDMDALYMPQFHPARDIHDVYFVKEPQFARSIPEPHLTRVAQTHQSGWKSGSVGWRYAFDVQRARRLVLRSQGTAVSARTLAGQGMSGGPKIPGKYFSMARCFRYDQVDATHACDFFQVEGIVLGEEINFRTLLGLLQLFALEVAKAREVKFLPAYFPFTEPSVELHVRHPKLGWMELGGAGLFRPEVTRPLGVEVPVIAWGLGLDRMAMVALEISDIRDLFSTDLDLIRTKRIKP